MNDPIARWRQEHLNFARLLDLLERELDRFHAGEAPNYELMLDVMYYMTHVPDLFHHPREDLAFERIRERDGSTGPSIDVVRHQHSGLRRDGDKLAEQLDDIVNGGIRDRESVETAGRMYVAAFRGHMDIEDRTLIPLARRVLDTEDWAHIDAAIADEADPVFGPSVAQRYAALGEQIRREAAPSAR
jgi:hemerythrin-like domain-containing protein